MNAVLTAALAIALFAPCLFFGEVPIFRDFTNTFLPFKLYAAAAFAAGRVPLWAPEMAFGTPFLANYQSGVLYPPSLIVDLLPNPTGIGLYLAFHFWIAGYGMDRFLERRGLPARARLFGAVTTMLGGVWISIAPWSHLAVASWIPLSMVAAEDLVSAPQAGRFAWLVVLLALELLGGAPESFAQAAAFVAAITVATAIRRRTGATAALRVALAALLAAALAEMSLVAGAPPPVPNAGVAGAWSPSLEDVYRRLAATTGPDRVWTLGDRSPAVLPPKLPTLTGLRSVGDYEPGALRRQAEYFTYLVQGSSVGDGPVPFEGRVFSLTPPPGRAPVASRRRLLDLAAVRWVVVPAAAEARADVAAFLRDAGLDPAPRLAPGIRLATNARALPRAFVTYRPEPAPPTEELLGRLSDEHFDPLVSSFVEGDVPRPGGPVPERGSPARIVRDEPHVVELEAELAADGLVVLADTFHPEWAAFVDGRATPIVPTNHLFRGVYVPAGQHRVRFVYRPTSLWGGAALSAAAIFVLVIIRRR